jgi:transposase-like protein
MRRFKPPYPPEFRTRIIELVRAGRTLSSLAKEFGVTDMTIRSWVRQADLDSGRRTDGLTTEEKQELARLRKENARLREERDILEKATALMDPHDLFMPVRALGEG